MVASVALLITIISNIKSYKQYINSLALVLSFSLFRRDGRLLLTVTNTGASKAEQIKFLSMQNNGDFSEIFQNSYFSDGFVLYPNETIEGQVAWSGETIIKKQNLWWKWMFLIKKERS